MLGQGHTNHYIHIIVVILKITTRFFQQGPLIIGTIISDSFGVTHAQYELRGYYVFHFGGANLIVNNNDIGLSEHLS